MKLLICAATPMEMFPSSFPGMEIRPLITGVGIAQCAYLLGRIFSNERFDYCLQIGIAGTFNPGLEIGTVVNVSRDCFADLGIEDHSRFIHLSEALPVDKSNPFEQYWIEPDMTITDRFHLPSVTGITVNTTHGDQSSIDRIINQYGADIETMEGAAFFAACLAANMPCVQIRSISNIIEPRNKANWNIPLAIQRLHLTIDRILPLLA